MASAEFIVRRAVASDAPEVASMVGELLTEIMTITGSQAFNFDLSETTERLADFIHREKYFVFAGFCADHKPARIYRSL
ncbi:MAG: hypothetical protein ACU836_12040 [Gammaproteobacteria bacterium]